MYTELKSYQIIISLLKQYGVRHLVLSPGARNVPFVHSVEEDDYFTCYSVVDERSAGYFALGLAQELGEPVLISCTSSTAACNYWPPVAEAFYQNVPIIVLTSDRDPQMLGNREDQMIDQVGMYDRHVRKSVNLPIVKDEDDFLYCSRLVNEALLELNHRGSGPVHINVPMKYYSTSFPCRDLPEVRKIDRICLSDDETVWNEKIDGLLRARRILVVCGQMSSPSQALCETLREFAKITGCAIAVEHMSNLSIEGSFNSSVCFDTHYVSDKKFEELLPEIVISFGGNVMSGVKAMLRRYRGQFDHWLIQEGGGVCDLFKSIKNIFECSPEYFFLRVANRGGMIDGDTGYREQILRYSSSVEIPAFPWSNVYAVRSLLSRMRPGSLIHASINSAIRISNFFDLAQDARFYANIGTYGIDGCLSSFLGQAAASPERACYLVIGDLSFFYDMNALRIRHYGSNVHIMLLNNHGGEEFYYNGMWQNDKSDLHTTARHADTARAWVESRGFKYLAASSVEEFDSQIDEFCGESSAPVFFEVFTEMSSDSQAVFDFYDKSRPHDAISDMKRAGKNLVKKTIGKEAAIQIADKLGVKLR